MESKVALLAEGVDRNLLATKKKTRPSRSPSSRRAWIEIDILQLAANAAGVALLAEGVDRNTFIHFLYTYRANVALLAEGVDRNSACSMRSSTSGCRPPRGGRG